MNETSSAIKAITLVKRNPRTEYRVDVRPGESFSEVLEKAGLSANDYLALKPSDQTEFRPDEEVYPHVGDGSKIHVTMHAEVGRA